MEGVVHINKARYDVYIGRSKDPGEGKWGNPYSHKADTLAKFRVRTRKEAIERYEEYLLSRPDLMADLHELKWKVLGCWCGEKACHGHILRKYVARLEQNLPLTLF